MQNRNSKKTHSKKRNLISYEISEVYKPLPELPVEIKQCLKQLTDGCTIYLPSLLLKDLPTLPKH